MVSSRRGNKRPLLYEPEGVSWMARTTFSSRGFESITEDVSLCGAFFHCVEHIINGRCPVPRFDSGCSASKTIDWIERW